MDAVATLPLVRVACPLCDAAQTRFERVVRGYRLERCRQCGLVFANPQLPPQDLLGGYEERDSPDFLSAFYERVTTPEKVAEYDLILAALEKLLGKPGRLLDFGCGPAYFIERAAYRGWEAHGVEVALWAEQEARRRGVRHFHRGLLVEQQFPDGHFDVVCANQVLEHLPTPRVDLAEMRRVIRPGGLFYANVPNYHTLPIMLERDDFELNFPMAHVNYFTPTTFAKLLTAAGFRVLWTSTNGGLKWENLVGVRTISEEVRAIHGEPPSSPKPAVNGSAAPQRRPLWKRVVFPAVKYCFYEWAQVGMSLEAFARKP
jgi:SAM-dependent methyltransferase